LPTTVPIKHRGSWAELTACSYLLSEGYEVFRNVSMCGVIDIVGIKGETVRRFDVKYIGGGSSVQLSAEQVQAGVELLCVGADGQCFTVSPPLMEERPLHAH
jgi:Holliday junction resolvase